MTPKKTSKSELLTLCEGNPTVSVGFPSQRASNMESVSMWWLHHGTSCAILPSLLWTITPLICAYLSPFVATDNRLDNSLWSGVCEDDHVFRRDSCLNKLIINVGHHLDTSGVSPIYSRAKNLSLISMDLFLYKLIMNVCHYLNLCWGNIQLYLYFVSFLSSYGWHRWSKCFPPHETHSSCIIQCHACWWPGEARICCISSSGIAVVIL